MTSLPLLRAGDARTLLLQGQGLLGAPERRADKRTLLRCVESLGFVQVDTINVIARAHHLTLAARFDHYRPETLARLLEDDRSLFEHWTHDASMIPTAFYRHWKPRFRRFRTSEGAQNWARRRLGPDANRVLRKVKARLRREGPLMSKDFEPDPSSDKRASKTGWGSSKRASYALSHLWRSGEIAVAGRSAFHKVYDLSERIFPIAHSLPTPRKSEHVDWLCSSALERLGVATAAELADFWNGTDKTDAARWCAHAFASGRVCEVEIESEDGSDRRRAFAVADFEERLARAPAPPDRARLLCPFDPAIRDRKRALRLFAFDYRFEGFVPKAQRRDGVYVMPILEGDQLVGRLDPKHHRESGVLEVRALRWQNPPSREQHRRLDQALERLARFVGATRIDGPARAKSRTR